MSERESFTVINAEQMLALEAAKAAGFIMANNVNALIVMRNTPENPFTNIHKQLYQAVKDSPHLFSLQEWCMVRDCGTVRCIAGWVVFLAGKLGERVLELCYGDYKQAARAIYILSGVKMEDVPDFFASEYDQDFDIDDAGEADYARVNDLALERLRKLAGE